MAASGSIGRLEVKADLDHLDAVAAWIDSCLRKAEAPEGTVHAIQLSAEELFTNVAMHGAHSGECRVTLALDRDERGFVLVLEDDGPPFDPLHEADAPDIEQGLDERPIGGLGIHLVRELSDRQHYRRVENRNRLTVGYLAPPAEPKAIETEAADDADDEPAGWRATLGLAVRFVAVVMLVFLGSIVVAGTLNYLKFERVYFASAQSRYDAVLRDVQAVIARSSGAGLDLGSNWGLQVVVNRVHTQHDSAIDIYLSDVDGSSLFSSTNAPPVDGLGELARDVAATGEVVKADAPGRFLTIGPIVMEGEVAGSITLSFASDGARTDVAILREKLVKSATLLAVIFVPILSLVAVLAIVPLERRYARVTRALRRVRHGKRDTGRLDHASPIIGHAVRIEETLGKAASAGEAR